MLRELNADIIALQEVLGDHEQIGNPNHLRDIAEELNLDFCFGTNRNISGHEYGNAILTCHPLHDFRNYDITQKEREPRGCLRADIEIAGDLMRVFNVHLGTSFMERRAQARRLLTLDELRTQRNSAQIPRIVLGDFNEWTHGLATQMFKSHFACAEPRLKLTAARSFRTRTYPGILPLLHLDHIYHDATLELQSISLHRNRLSLIASDHLPLVADFKLNA